MDGHCVGALPPDIFTNDDPHTAISCALRVGVKAMERFIKQLVPS